MNVKPIVCICCSTYNHASYIEDAMKGFAMQYTTFPYTALIIDDASTDGEQEVINSYLNEHFNMSNARKRETDEALFVEATHVENQNCNFVAIFLKRNYYQIKKSKTPLYAEWIDLAKYIALCEGDDYWIDDNKLQEQVSFLESHPAYTMCYSGFDTVDESGQPILRTNYEKAMRMSKSGDILIDLLVTNFILTCTTLLRNDVFSDYNNLGFKYGHDYTLFLFAATKGKCKFFPQHMSAYRKTSTGAMATMSDKVVGWFHETRLFFYKGILDGTIPIYQHKYSVSLLNTIAKYCFFERDNQYRSRYQLILRKHKILWPFLLPLYLKRLYVTFKGDV